MPPPPPPSRVFTPDHPLDDDLLSRFGEAVSRAKAWR
jgi:hypothetical protein